MDASSLAVEMAPIIMRQKGDSRADYYSHIYYTSKGPLKTADLASDYNASDYLMGKLSYFFLLIHYFLKHLIKNSN